MRFLKSFILPLAFASGMSIFTSCKSTPDSDPTPGSDSDPVTPVTPSGKDAMSPAEQKEYLEKVAIEFMNAIPSSDFNEIADLGKYINETYGEDYDWDEVGDWAENIFDTAKKALGTQTTETENYSWGGYTSTYNDIYTNYNSLLFASNFTGHFTAQNGKWNLSKANDLQFIFKDQSDRECIIKLETSGNIKKVHAFNLDEWQGSDYNNNGNDYTYNYYYDRTQYTIGVPERIVVTLTQGGSQVIRTTVNIDLNSITGEEFDISKNSLTASMTTELNNGYKFETSQIAYTANQKASATFSMTKNGKALVTAAVSSDISDLPSCNVSAFTSDFDLDDYDTDKANAKKAYAKLDIMGKVQIQGTVSDVRKAVDYINKAEEDYKYDEANYKSYINQANGLCDMNLFYDNSATKQATIKLEPFTEESWGGHTKWISKPVICFYDGSSYSTFEAFFNETDFKKVIDSFKSLANKYADLIDEEIDW